MYNIVGFDDYVYKSGLVYRKEKHCPHKQFKWVYRKERLIKKVKNNGSLGYNLFADGKRYFYSESQLKDIIEPINSKCMEITKDDLDKIVAFANDKMVADKLYPISEKASICFKQLIAEGKLKNIIFSENDTKVCKSVVSNNQLNKLFDWVTKTMLVNKWYDITSDSQRQCFIHLFGEGLMNNCEFNENLSKIRKIDFI